MNEEIQSYILKKSSSSPVTDSNVVQAALVGARGSVRDQRCLWSPGNTSDITHTTFTPPPPPPHADKPLAVKQTGAKSC